MDHETSPAGGDEGPRPSNGGPERELEPAFAITNGPDQREWNRVIQAWPGPCPVHFVTDAGHYVIDIEKVGRAEGPEEWLFSGAVVPSKNARTVVDDQRAEGKYSLSDQSGSLVLRAQPRAS